MISINCFTEMNNPPTLAGSFAIARFFSATSTTLWPHSHRHRHTQRHTETHRDTQVNSGTGGEQRYMGVAAQQPAAEKHTKYKATQKHARLLAQTHTIANCSKWRSKKTKNMVPRRLSARDMDTKMHSNDNMRGIWGGIATCGRAGDTEFINVVKYASHAGRPRRSTLR